MDVEVSEVVERWHISVHCEPDETPAVAASIAKMVAGMNKLHYPGDTIYQLPAESPGYSFPTRPQRRSIRS